jgi:hypothetical protein
MKNEVLKFYDLNEDEMSKKCNVVVFVTKIRAWLSYKHNRYLH